MEGSERRAAAGSGDDVGAWGEASPRSDGFAGASRPQAGRQGFGVACSFDWVTDLFDFQSDLCKANAAFSEDL